MELQVNEDYELDNLVKDWGFEKFIDWNFNYYYKTDNDGLSVLKIFNDRDVFIMLKKYHIVDDEILCLLYDLIKAGIIIKV